MGFSIKHLLLAVVYVAIGLAALANLSNDSPQLLLRLFVFVTLIFAAYSTWINSEERRAFYFGLTLWTTLYLLTHVTFPRRLPIWYRLCLAKAARIDCDDHA